MFMAQIGCAAIGVAAFALFGPGWLAKSAALAASIAFMIYTRSTHPPAASLPVLFIDGVKLHHLSFWYAFFPGAAGCIILSLIIARSGLLLERQSQVLISINLDGWMDGRNMLEQGIFTLLLPTAVATSFPDALRQYWEKYGLRFENAQICKVTNCIQITISIPLNI
ncbi:momilactone A synthase [Hibiscus syriacus]|uniref:Momilactone A synthase n=1 Tax=Hibiscus syriacus TaxID=106335 RepID=A0A6A3AIH0_HIBSY|nr:momilactone A synthase [Hibiscus syriacus]